MGPAISCTPEELAEIEMRQLAIADDLTGRLASVLTELRDEMKLVRENILPATVEHLQIVSTYASNFDSVLEIVGGVAAELREEALMAWTEHPDRPTTLGASGFDPVELHVDVREEKGDGDQA
jgi:hypothetical protein